MSTADTFKILPSTIRRGHSIETEFQVQAETYRIFFRSSDIPLTGNLESSLAAILLPCMSLGGGRIIAEGEISRRLLSNLPTIQDIFCTWLAEFKRAELEGAKPVSKARSSEDRIGAFFSGGVDSYYTFLKHRDEITDLIYIHGLETHLDKTLLRERISRDVREVATAFGKNVIEVETNIRSLLDPYVRFGVWGHGIALPIIGHLLHPSIHRIFIPATYTYAYLIPKGTHPILDPLWSTEALEFVHDGCEASRLEKTASIAKHDIALSHLHVCHRSNNEVYNCGRCEKCLRTMINLELNGALDRCSAFDSPLRIENILQLDLADPSLEYFMKENLDALNRQGGDGRLRKALRKILNRPIWLRRLMARKKRYQRSLARRFPGYQTG